MTTSRIGLWLIGAKGGVASTAILGLTALQRGLVESAGLVTQLPQFSRLNLADWGQFVIGGHEIRRAPLAGEIFGMARQSRHPALPAMAEQCRPEFERIDTRIRPGTIIGVGATIASLADWDLPHDETPAQAIDRLGRDLDEFVRAEGLEHLVVVYVASTEPPADESRLPEHWEELERMLNQDAAKGGQSHFRGGKTQSTDGAERAAKIGTVPSLLPASSLYAIAALSRGHSFINFTPSLADRPAAIGQLALQRGACHYGCDGKTGETLMKSVLAPMFARRNLRVLSWVGHNIFGNMDGVVLNDPENKRNKVASKDRLLGEILGYRPNTLVSIEYLSDLGDWKTAWDHIHFAGFLGVPMTLQFIWQGCDSLLAAPLVLDLARLAEFAHRRGHAGEMPFLASFFKSPYGQSEHRFDRQFHALEEWVARMSGQC
jgi:myo-inositol-1-phosphate synthase